jgi:TonB-linked SusC/RagA family outer membrane protein
MIRSVGLRATAARLLTVLALLLPVVAHAQGTVLTGKVQSEQGQVLTAANVLIPELNISAATNAAGVYTITIPEARIRTAPVVLRIRAIGFVPQSRQVSLSAGSQTLNFDLRKDVTELSAIVVTGVTSATEQVKLPFTVNKIDESQMPVSGSNPIAQLQGKIPGALIVSATGRPGAAPDIILRGPVSLNATGRTQSPLYLLDGVPLAGGLPDINPGDIENVEVVKGAAAASLYGARAGAGVINITTKSGKNAPAGVKFNIRSEVGAGDIEGKFPLATRSALSLTPDGKRFCSAETLGGAATGAPCARYIDWDQEIQRINNSGEDFSLSPQKFLRDFGIASAPNYGQLTGLFLSTPWPEYRDPVRQLTTSQPFSNNSIDMRGKAGNTSVYASADAFNQTGAVRDLEGFRRNSARINVDQVFGDRISGSVNSYYSQSIDHASQLDETGSGTTGVWFNLTRAPGMADLLAKDNLGRVIVRSTPLSQGEQNGNPLYPVIYNRRADNNTRFVGGGTLKYTPFDWLNLDAAVGYDRATNLYTQQRDKGWRVTAQNTNTSSGFIGNGSLDNATLTTSASAAATHTFFGDLASTFTTRVIYGDQKIKQQDLSGTGIVVPGLVTADAATTNYAVSSTNQIIRDMGMFAGVDLDYKDRYVLSGLIRRDGSSLFGEGNRWQTFGRVAGAWIASREPWWPAPNALSLFKLRASQGTTGQRPRFSAQYETFTIGTGGTLTPLTLGNKNLKPEINRETEVGTDLEFFNKIGVNVSYSRAVIDQQILPVTPPTASGFQRQWQNAGEVTNQTWEATLTVPVVQKKNFSWTNRVIYDQTISVITRLDVPEFTGTVFPAGGGSTANPFELFKFRKGERIGTMYGFDFVKKCEQLPGAFATQCSMNAADLTASYRPNRDGYIVWLGANNKETEGVTKNLWTAQTGLGNGPWGNNTNWGMPISLRDAANNPCFCKLGNGLPKYHWGLSQNMEYKRLSLYGLLDASMGQKLWNLAYHWSLGDLQSKEIDQTGVSIEDAKPLGYFWRRGPSTSPGGNAGIGGFYDALGPSSFSVEDASYVKLREVNASYHVGSIGGRGDWKFGVVGRNLKTWSDFRGFDPEAGNTTGPFNSSALTPVSGFRFPNLRTVTVQLSTSF